MSLPNFRVHIRNEADMHDAVMSARQAAEASGFSPARQLSIATCASELATNILKYAARGWIQTTPIEGGLLLVAEDKGPGIPDVEMALRDHYSSSGTLGLGLPGVRRMADEFEIVTASKMGTKVIARFFRAPASNTVSRYLRQETPRPSITEKLPQPSAGTIAGSPGTIETGTHRRPAPGEVHCGDRSLARQGARFMWLALVDGLGHGEAAAAYANAAIRAMEDAADSATTATEMLKRAHDVLYQSRGGAAAGVIRVNLSNGEAVSAGIGNVRMARFARLEGDGDTPMLCVDGILGERWRTPRETHVMLHDMDLLFLASDGIPVHFSPADLPSLRHGTLGHLATEVVERYGKFHDDASCLLARWHL